STAPLQSRSSAGGRKCPRCRLRSSDKLANEHGHAANIPRHFRTGCSPRAQFPKLAHSNTVPNASNLSVVPLIRQAGFLLRLCAGSCGFPFLSKEPKQARKFIGKLVTRSW